jgi:hypothetical protein
MEKCQLLDDYYLLWILEWTFTRTKNWTKKLFFVNKWINVMVKYETILENEAHWLMLEGLLGGKVVS